MVGFGQRRHHVAVPRDLEALISIDQDGEVFAPRAGLAAEDVREIWKARATPATPTRCC
jgi:hypothetical protein